MSACSDPCMGDGIDYKNKDKLGLTSMTDRTYICELPWLRTGSYNGLPTCSETPHPLEMMLLLRTELPVNECTCFTVESILQQFNLCFYENNQYTYATRRHSHPDCLCAHKQKVYRHYLKMNDLS